MNIGVQSTLKHDGRREKEEKCRRKRIERRLESLRGFPVYIQYSQPRGGNAMNRARQV